MCHTAKHWNGQNNNSFHLLISSLNSILRIVEARNQLCRVQTLAVLRKLMANPKLAPVFSELRSSASGDPTAQAPTSQQVTLTDPPLPLTHIDHCCQCSGRLLQQWQDVPHFSTAVNLLLHYTSDRFLLRLNYKITSSNSRCICSEVM